MSRGSGTCTTPKSTDPRDCMGYAIAEAGFGTLNNGVFTDLVQHRPDRKQTATYASSVDPWHRETDRVRDQEQPGLDIVFQSGVTRGIPATVPIPMMYSTPENAAAEIRYLEARGYPIARVEMGEEPDGQYVTPEDDAALYAQFADALHAVDSHLQLGGPVFESNSRDVKAWADGRRKRQRHHGRNASWRLSDRAQSSGRSQFLFLRALSVRRLRQPRGRGQSLARTGPCFAHRLGLAQRRSLPAGLPMFITETNYSQNETDAAQEVTGALWYADMMGSLLSTGASGAFFYEYEPIPLSPAYPCKGWGSYGVLEGDRKYSAQAPLSQYFAAQMLTQNWSAPGNDVHTLYPALIAGMGCPAGDGLSAGAARRPSGLCCWSTGTSRMPTPRRVQFNTTTGPAWFSGSVTQTQFGPEQYAWIEEGVRSYPNPDGPPSTTQVSGGPGHGLHAAG